MARRAEHHFLSGFASTKRIQRDQTWHHIFSAGPALEAKSSMKSGPQDREVASHCPSSAKQQQVLEMLRRPEGATVAQIAEATGWQAHTVRGFFAGLKKRGIEVSVLERVRQVGPGKEDDRGSYTAYRAHDID
jgi:hypothetical protein